MHQNDWYKLRFITVFKSSINNWIKSFVKICYADFVVVYSSLYKELCHMFDSVWLFHFTLMYL